MLHFATLFDINYLSRALALLDSLKKHVPKFCLHVLCIDEETYHYFSCHPTNEVLFFSLSDVEDHFNELRNAKNNRTKVEYIFTLSPFLPLFVLVKNPTIEMITSLDADLYFFSDPSSLFEKEDFSVLITPHRFTKNLKDREQFGLYNVSFQTFRRNETGLKFLTEWAADCAEWCYYRHENGNFADQKYLDKWPKLDNQVKPLSHIGAGLAPWNIGNFILKIDQNHKVWVEKTPLIFYHFHAVRVMRKHIFYLGFHQYQQQPDSVLLEYVYKPYLKKLISYGTISDRGIQRRGTKYSFFTLLIEESLYFCNSSHIFIIPNFSFLKRLKRILNDLKLF